MFHVFIDGMDMMVDNLGKYNGTTAAAIGLYQAQQVMMQVQLSQMLEPLMTWWVELKSQVLTGMMSALQKIVPALKAMWEALSLIYKFSGLKVVLDLLMDSFKFMADMATAYAKTLLDLTIALMKLLGWISPGFDALTNDLQKSLQKLQESLNGNPANNEAAARDMSKNMMMPAGRGTKPLLPAWVDPRAHPAAAPVRPPLQGAGGAMVGQMSMAGIVGALALQGLQGATGVPGVIGQVPGTKFQHPKEKDDPDYNSGRDDQSKRTDIHAGKGPWSYMRKRQPHEVKKTLSQEINELIQELGQAFMKDLSPEQMKKDAEAISFQEGNDSKVVKNILDWEAARCQLSDLSDLRPEIRAAVLRGRKGHAGHPAATQPAAPITAHPPVNAAVHPQQFPGFSNRFNVPIEMVISNDRAMQDAVHQIRGELIKMLNVARDETRLLAGQFDGGLAMGM